VIAIDYEIMPIDRELPPLWRASPAPDLSAVSEMDLCYEYFLSRIDFIVEEENIGERWGSLPLLDFTASMKFLRDSIDRLKEVGLDFTENDHVVRFLRRDDVVEVHDSWASGVLECGKSELILAATAFIERVCQELSSGYPAIRSNTFFAQLMEL
jgi:hypothetical protein